MIAKFLAQNLALRIPFLQNHKRTLNGGLTLFGGLAITHAIAKRKAL